MFKWLLIFIFFSTLAFSSKAFADSAKDCAGDLQDDVIKISKSDMIDWRLSTVLDDSSFKSNTHGFKLGGSAVGFGSGNIGYNDNAANLNKYFYTRNESLNESTKEFIAVSTLGINRLNAYKNCLEHPTSDGFYLGFNDITPTSIVLTVSYKKSTGIVLPVTLVKWTVNGKAPIGNQFKKLISTAHAEYISINRPETPMIITVNGDGPPASIVVPAQEKPIKPILYNISIHNVDDEISCFVNDKLSYHFFLRGGTSKEDMTPHLNLGYNEFYCIITDHAHLNGHPCWNGEYEITQNGKNYLTYKPGDPDTGVCVYGSINADHGFKTPVNYIFYDGSNTDSPPAPKSN